MYTLSCFLLAVGVFTTINAACISSVRQPCVYKQIPGCSNFDIASGVITCPVSCPNLCSCTGTSTLCSCGAPKCSCFKDTDNLCEACKPEPSPICSCLAQLDLPCNCEARKTFVYFPETSYPLTVLEMNPYYTNTCYSF